VLATVRHLLDDLRGSLPTTLCRAFGASDVKRWAGSDSVCADWDDRTRQIAALVRSGSSVLEFGAGRMV
jgi:hypothetical protein